MKVDVLKTYDKVWDWFASRSSTKYAIDTELVDKEWLTMEIAGISFCDGLGACYIDLCDNPEIDKITELLRILCSETIEKFIFHNAPFDLMVLKKYNILTHTPEIFCTMTAAHLISESQPKSLKKLAVKYLHIDPAYVMTFDEASDEGFSSNKFYHYALDDVIWTWWLYTIFRRKLADEHLEDLFYNIEMPFQFCLMDMKINGALVDRNVIKNLHIKVQTILEKLELDMYKAGGITYTIDKEENRIPSVNLNSPHQLSDFLIGLGVKLIEKTKPSKAFPEGVYSTKETVLKSVANQHEFVRLLLEYRKANSLMVKFLKPLPEFIEEDGRIRANFHNTVAVTGRLSSSRPNLQQLPKDNTGPLPLRQCIVAPKGYKLLCADYSGQELRVLAHVSNDPTMISAFKRNLDVHFFIANEFFDLKIPEECLVTTHPEYVKYRVKFKEERDKIKTVNFGLAYGKTAYGFAKDWNIPVKEAQEFIDSYFEKFSNIKAAMDRCTNELRMKGKVVTILHRVRRLTNITHRAIRQAFNFLIQSPSADMMKASAGNFRDIILANPHWDCKLILSVHDELVYEVKEDFAYRARKELKDTMESAVQLSIPVIVDVGVGDNYAEAKL